MKGRSMYMFKKWFKYILLFVWLVIVDYSDTFMGMEKNMYFLLVRLPVAIGVGWLILYLFRDREQTVSDLDKGR